jgi:hypothetical protein
MASGIGFFVGGVFAVAIFGGGLVTAIFSPWWGAVCYSIAIYALFAGMAFSSLCVQVRKNRAWEELSELQQRVLHRHRAFFYFPFSSANFGCFCNLTRILAMLWAIFCVWRTWYWLAGILAFFDILSTPMIAIWIPIPIVWRRFESAQERLNAVQHILDERDALGF